MAAAKKKRFRSAGPSNAFAASGDPAFAGKVPLIVAYPS
jgi:hypothetical protein